VRSIDVVVEKVEVSSTDG